MDHKEIMKKCTDLYEDFEFSYIKEWKKRTGGKAMGLFPMYVPKEVIHAAGVLPVELYGGGEIIDIVKGDSYYQSYICHIPRSVIDLALTGKLDILEGIICPFTCDVVRNFTGVYKLLFPEKYSRFFDQPQNFIPEIGGEYFYNQCKEIIADLEKMTGIEVTVDRLNNSIELYNENRRLIERLYDERADRPWLVQAAEVYLLMRAGNILEVSEYNQLIKDYLESVVRQVRKAEDKARVIVTGAFCEQPSVSMIRAMELSGCYIVDDDFILGNRYLSGDIAINKDPLRSLALSYVQSEVPSSCRFEEYNSKNLKLVEQVKKRQAEGVILAAPSFCDPSLEDRPFYQKALDQANIRYISFQYSEDASQFGSIKEQIGTFTDSIKLWEE